MMDRRPQAPDRDNRNPNALSVPRTDDAMTELKRLANRDLIQDLTQAGANDPLWLEFIARFRAGIRVTVLRTLRTEAERTPGVAANESPELIEDLTQEVFVRLHEFNRRALSRFQGRTELSAYTYLNTIAVNLVRDHCKSLRALKTPKVTASLSHPVTTETATEGPNYAQTLVSEGPGPERFIAARELREEIRVAIDQVAPSATTVPRDRSIFQLFFVERLTVDEIARKRSIRLSASGVEKRIRRMREALKAKFSTE